MLDTGTGRDHGDPFVLRHGRRYYLYYTGPAGIEVWSGDDLVHWSPAGPALVAPDGDHWAQVDLWAPEILYADGVFYMYVTGTRHQSVGRARNPGVGVDSGDDRLPPAGDRPRERSARPVRARPGAAARGLVDRRPPVRGRRRPAVALLQRPERVDRYRGTVPGCGNLVDELVAPDAVSGRPTPVTLPDAAWEGHRDGIWYWNEGPTVLRRRGRYVQMYSGGWYGDASYGVGFATADAPRGPWVKAPHNPVFVSGTRITGPGHHCVTVGPDGVTPYAVYHGYVDGELGRKVHVDRLRWSAEGPRIGAGPAPGVPTETEQPVPDAAVYDPAIPYWHAELWVRGERVRLGDLVVDLPPGRVALLDVTQREHATRVLVDGRLVALGEPSGDAARVALELVGGTAVDGEVHALALTTWREDEDLRVLAPGAVLDVTWGGTLPLELSVAVDGAATVRLVDGLDVLAEAGVAGGQVLPELVRLRTDRRVSRVEIEAGPDGARVSDLVLTARPRDLDGVGSEPVTGEIPLPRTAADG